MRVLNAIFFIPFFRLSREATPGCEFFTTSNSNSPAFKTSECQGYELVSTNETHSGMIAHLRLSGQPCGIYGRDVKDLTVEASFETENRLHVHIFDTSRNQFQIPESVFPLPKELDTKAKDNHSLSFGYNPKPFEFWISRSAGERDVLFDTRGYRLVFEDQYLELTSKLPHDANIYGLGEVISSSGFRRDPDNTTQTMWARDKENPVDENEYGIHPVYYEHRISTIDGSIQGKTHAVFLKNSHGMDVKLRQGLVSYHAIGGTLDFYFFAGPAPIDAIEQYVQLVGLPAMQPYWAFGFHLCRWGYQTLTEIQEVTRKMREANIPLETQWSDIDYMLSYQNFKLASDKSNRYPAQATKKYISELHKNHQQYIPIVDAGIHVVDPNNVTDIYDVYTKGAELGVFLKNPDGSEYIGKVWPGFTVFPDWFSNNTLPWWTEALKNFSETQLDFDGIWLDMNEPSSFCDGSCGTGANLSDISTGIVLPGSPGNLVTAYPEGYDPNVLGPSGNMTMGGISSNRDVSSRPPQVRRVEFAKRSEIAISSPEPTIQYADIPDDRLNNPPYSIANAAGPLNHNTVSVNATHHNGIKVYHTHNLWGHMEASATHAALLKLRPDRRPFIVSRSTFSGSGRKTSHWLGDNYSTWFSMRTAIQGVLDMQTFGIPMVGPDTCGFKGNTDEDLCNRWMMLSAWFPFYRNHNILGSISQEPYVWDSVAEASRKALSTRYRLLPYLYSAMAQASITGTPPIRALFWEFPNNSFLLKKFEQFMFGPSILVTPVLEPNASTVIGNFPGDDIWRDLYTYEPLKVPSSEGQLVKVAAPISHINAHIRGGSVILQHSIPAYTTFETRNSLYELLVSPDKTHRAQAITYMDDGITPNSTSAQLVFSAEEKKLKGMKTPGITSHGLFHIEQHLSKVVILGPMTLNELKLNETMMKNPGRPIRASSGQQLAWEIGGLDIDLNQPWELAWS